MPAPSSKRQLAPEDITPEQWQSIVQQYTETKRAYDEATANLNRFRGGPMRGVQGRPNATPIQSAGLMEQAAAVPKGQFEAHYPWLTQGLTNPKAMQDYMTRYLTQQVQSGQMSPTQAAQKLQGYTAPRPMAGAAPPMGTNAAPGTEAAMAGLAAYQDPSLLMTDYQKGTLDLQKQQLAMQQEESQRGALYDYLDRLMGLWGQARSGQEG